MQIGIIVIRIALGIDNRAIEAHARTDRVHDVIGALRQLKFGFGVDFNAVEIGDPHRIHVVFANRHDVAPKIVAIQFVTADATDARENLPRHQERHQQRQSAAKRRRGNIDQIIFVTAERMPAEMVDAVGVERHIVAQFQIVNKVLQNHATGTVVSHDIVPIDAFRRGIFFVTAHSIDVQARAVNQKTARTSGFKSIIARVQIHQTDAAA